ncbi:hypothetical protein QUC31_018090 [Theobroma cacao]|uniref:Uncharacterized protein n=1 Tax=Theobroma cacao TaxID=3641 RepID=A0A061EC87_THECC|nr:Uncharacterized protein TCM_017025 [Theobroma cacao]
MKAGVVLKLLICLFLLGQYQISAARPVAGMMGLKDQHQEMNGKQVNGQEPVPQSQLWTEDYSLPRRRRPVHNKFDP